MLKDEGLTVKRSQALTLQVSEDPETGYEWITDDESTNGLFKIYDSYVPPKKEEGSSS